MKSVLQGGWLCLLLLFGSGCTVLPKATPAVQDRYMLEYSAAGQGSELTDGLPVLIVTAPLTHGGYDTTRIAYLQRQYGLRYFARSRWADTPARMLAPLLAEGINTTGTVLAVYASPGAVSARYRLDTELVRLHQDFSTKPSGVHLTLRAQLVDLSANRVLASRQFDIREAADSEDTYGGVQAANRAVAQLITGLAEFSRQVLD